MNIIKLQDKIMPDTMPQAEYFNKYLKGKYAYWIQMRYIVSFEHMRHEGYVACEEDINKLLPRKDGTYPKPYGAPSLDVYADGVINYVDSIETDNINNTIGFRAKNKYASDEDITIDELKMFRTWLAKELLKMDQTELGEQKKTYFNDIETHILEYYANDMYNSIIKMLSEVAAKQITIGQINTSACNCHNSNLSSLYNMELNSCDPVNVYKKGIYEGMVKMFSNFEFWQQWPSEFINEFKKYIDNIINCDFVLTQSSWKSEFIDCTCQSKSDQEMHMEILKRLSVSLGYIRDGQINSHKNYINDALYDWSSILYEKMKW